jgi:hypothetical protein
MPSWDCEVALEREVEPELPPLDEAEVPADEPPEAGS